MLIFRGLTKVMCGHVNDALMLMVLLMAFDINVSIYVEFLNDFLYFIKEILLKK